MVHALLLIVVLGGDFPRALVELEKTRAAIRRADIAWERTDFRNSFVPGVPKQYRSAFTENESALIADGTVACEGTPGGVTAWTADGEPVVDSRFASLTTPESRWTFESDYLMGKVWDKPNPADRQMDVRVIGLMPLPIFDSDPETVLRQVGAGHAHSFTETVVDGIHVVELVLSGGDSKYVWHIDPAKGWNCIRAQAISKGAVIAESLTEYSQTDNGVWFPASVDYYGKSMEPLVRIDVNSAKINSSDLPSKLTPESIGFGSCMQVIRVHPDGKSGDIMKYVADGRIESPEEYSKLLKTGATSVDPRLVEFDRKRREASERRNQEEEALARKAKVKGEAIATQPADEWERYVAEFLVKHDCDVDQRQRAMLILLQCQERRETFLRTRERDLAELGKELVSADDPQRKNEVERRLGILRLPLQEIFERQLKPRPEKLLTRKQRAAQASASEPPAP